MSTTVGSREDRRRLTADTDFSSTSGPEEWRHPDTPSEHFTDITESVQGYDAFRDALLDSFQYCHENNQILWLAPASERRPRVQ